MKNEIVVTAPTIEQALEEALEQLGAQREDVEIEVIEEPVKRFFGEPTNAKVRVYLLEAKEDEPSEGNEGFDDAFSDDEYDDTGNEVGDDDQDDLDDADDLNDLDDLDDDAPLDGEGENFVEEGEDEGELADEQRNFNKASVHLSEDELDVIADSAIETIYEFLSYFGIENAEIEEYEGDEGELILDIVGDNLAVLIGRHGKTLDAFQFLVSSIVGKKSGYRHPVIIDVEGYKHRRKQKLIGIARASAARAIRNKREVKMRPMSPYERRIIHVALKDDKRIITRSDGVDPERHVVIKPV
jgi:spoIIIJ-associated protein